MSSARGTAVVAGLVLAALATAVPAAVAAPPPVKTTTIHLSPTGNDRNNGKTTRKPLRTLDGVQQLLRKSAARNVLVLVTAGTYERGQTNWTHDKDVVVTFQAQPGTSPVFSGRKAGGDHYWFQSNARKTKLRFKGLTVQEYNLGGIYLKGSTDLVVEGMHFTKLGTKFHAGEYGRGAVHLRSSSRALIRDNRFSNLENHDKEAAKVHGVYLAEKSSLNLVSGNRFTTISGDPVRVRDGSNNNTVQANNFSDTGYQAIVSDWQQPQECLSFGNHFTGNRWGAGYRHPDGTVNKIKMLATRSVGQACGGTGPRFVARDNNPSS